MRCLTLNACKIFCTNFPGCHPPFSYSRKHTLSDYVGGPLCQSGHGYPSRYVRPAASACFMLITPVQCDQGEVFLCILAESSGDLQRMLQTLATWCENWNLVLNTAKTQVVHFRNRKSPRNAF